MRDDFLCEKIERVIADACEYRIERDAA